MYFTYLLLCHLRLNHLILFTDYCPKYTSPEACQQATTSDITCFWCDNAKLCIDSTDQDAHNMKVTKCHVE
ncbi:unnamed protein product, partial [Schistosoma bovis]